jgi:hypothetical protein
MDPSPALRGALADLVAAERAVAAVSDRKDAGRKTDLVKARRLMAEQLGVVGLLIENEPGLADRPGDKSAVTRQFSAMRAQLAVHQANWPAVRIDDDPAAYRRSALAVRDKVSAFWDICQSLWAVSR